MKPNVIIYGLDANAVYYELDQTGFTTAKERLPTMRDGNSAEPACYDFICAKTHESFKIALKNYYYEGINYPELLDNTSKISSDHLPTITKITVGR